MAQCRHGLEEEFCHTCKHPEPVYITGGGSAYHRSPDCEYLHEGQLAVERRGGTTEPVERVSQSKAEGMGRRRCRGCYP